MQADGSAQEENDFQQMFHRCTKRTVVITNQENSVWQSLCVCYNTFLLRLKTSLFIHLMDPSEATFIDLQCTFTVYSGK